MILWESGNTVKMACLLCKRKPYEKVKLEVDPEG